MESKYVLTKKKEKENLLEKWLKKKIAQNLRREKLGKYGEMNIRKQTLENQLQDLQDV